MLDDLVRTVEKLQKRIRAHGDSIRQYELRTRVSLIDPMLHALGWEVGDPTQVELEKPNSDDGRPDYALLGVTGKPVLLIEAKKLGVTREPTRQVVSYVVTENISRDFKVSFCACTDGDFWRVFDVGTQDMVVDTRLSQDAAADCAFKLLGLWRTSLVDASLRTPVMLPSEETNRNSGKTTKETRRSRESGTRKPAVPGARSLWEIAQMDKADLARLGEPRSITFPGEPTQPLRNQKELIVSVANYLARTKCLTADNGTLRSGTKRYIVHSSPEHANGRRFNASVKLAKGLYLETSNPFSQQVQYAYKLLLRYGPPELDSRVMLGRWE